MTDKERILTAIITRIIPRLQFHEYSKYISTDEKLQKGDLVFGMTTISPNDFQIGFVHEVKDDCVVIREIGSDRLCNYYNELFYKINTEDLGYQILEKKEYATYIKCRKAFSEYAQYFTAFGGVEFENGICKLKAREKFTNNIIFEVFFKYNSKTTIKQIGKLIEIEEEKLKNKEKE